MVEEEVVVVVASEMEKDEEREQEEEATGEGTPTKTAYCPPCLLLFLYGETNSRSSGRWPSSRHLQAPTGRSAASYRPLLLLLLPLPPP